MVSDGSFMDEKKNAVKKDDLSVFDYRSEKLKKNCSYYLNEAVSRKYKKQSYRDPECGYVDGYVFYPAERGSKPLPVVFDFHGGGMVLGFPEQDFFYAEKMSEECHCIVVVVDYPLAPEFKYPKAIYASYRYIRSFLKKKGVETSNVFLIGHSGGSNICCGIINLANRFSLKIRGFISNYGLFRWDNIVKNALDSEKAISNKRMMQYFNWYFEKEESRYEVLASPVFGDISIYPPVLLNCAGYDSLLEEEKEFDRLMRESGVDSHMCVYSECMHGFTHPHLKEYDPIAAQQAFKMTAEFIKERVL